MTEDAPSSPDVAATPAPAGAETPPPAVGGPVTRAMGVSGRAKVATQIASVAVVDASGRVLFGKRRDDGRWTLPGGHLEPGEAPIAGAARELAEETRIVVPTTRLAPLGTGRVGDYGSTRFASISRATTRRRRANSETTRRRDERASVERA